MIINFEMSRVKYSKYQRFGLTNHFNGHIQVKYLKATVITGIFFFRDFISFTLFYKKGE